jgi:hypothetical protein
VSAPLAQRHYFAHHGVAAIIVSTTPRPAGLIGTGRWSMWMAQAKPERSCSGLKLVRHTESSAADVHQLQDRGLASGDRRQAVVGIAGSPRTAASGP